MTALWRDGHRSCGLEGVVGGPRPGASRSIIDAQGEEQQEREPRHVPQISGLWQGAVVRTWRPFGMKAHSVGDFNFSKYPQLVDKVREIVELPDRSMVLCVDEQR